MNDEMIEITRERFEELNDCEDKLLAFEAAGVDNWSGYDFAMEILNGEHD